MSEDQIQGIIATIITGTDIEGPGEAEYRGRTISIGSQWHPAWVGRFDWVPVIDGDEVGTGHRTEEDAIRQAIEIVDQEEAS